MQLNSKANANSGIFGARLRFAARDTHAGESHGTEGVSMCAGGPTFSWRGLDTMVDARSWNSGRL